jgi:Asp/Glu/hydantoin racemase
MEICAQLPISMPEKTYATYYELLMRAYELFKDDGTDITIRDVPTGIKTFELVNYFGFREINDVEVVKSILKAEAEGFDGVAGACYFDSGIKTSSSLMSIPVVGAAEASMHLAGIMGRKAAVITSEPAWIPEMEQHLMDLGFGAAAISHKPVRALSVPMDKMLEGLMSGDYTAVIEDFTAVSKQCIDEGADVLIAGCGLISPMFTVNWVTEIDGAPVIDPMIASLKITEMLVRLSKKGMPIKTGRGLFQTPPGKLKIPGLKELKTAT